MVLRMNRFLSDFDNIRRVLEIDKVFFNPIEPYNGWCQTTDRVESISCLDLTKTHAHLEF